MENIEKPAHVYEIYLLPELDADWSISDFLDFFSDPEKIIIPDPVKHYSFLVLAEDIKNNKSSRPDYEIILPDPVSWPPPSGTAPADRSSAPAARPSAHAAKAAPMELVDRVPASGPSPAPSVTSKQAADKAPEEHSSVPPAASPAASAAAPVGRAQAPPAPEGPAERAVYRMMPGLIEIVLERPGWIYAGEKENKKGIVLDSRNVGEKETTFKFRVEKEDNYSLSFQLQNNDGTLEYSNILLEDIEEDGVEPDEKIDAPSDDPALESAIKGFETYPAELPDLALDSAEKFISDGNFSLALELLEQIAEANPGYKNLDRVYYLIGKIYETDSSLKNPSKAVHYYSLILDNYPFSDYLQDAERRIRYIKRFFIHIR